MSNILITGCSRGLGLELVRQCSARASKEGGLVIAASRNLSQDLNEVISQSHGSAVFIDLDVTDSLKIAQSAEEVHRALKGCSLDILINCAGVFGTTQGKLALMDNLEYQLSVNVTGAHSVIREYIPLMQDSKVKKVVNISSGFASMTLASSSTYAPCPAYKISKAALNALTVQYALSYKDDGFIFVPSSPGWIKTDMGGEDADLTVTQGAEAVLNVVDSITHENNGQYKSVLVPGWDAYSGQDLPW
ncbi:hypothetical protein ASPSYDRAFT_168547 [Aspergillus sydowii CBS 593.65]|uniref:Uncharacterized protein n=1 Tax=Aspergillus sydowii CBS 593.65 TaxID=1036612 RepID=A0A1L9TZ41_9EURO|nr:uncharacterized protein ASPSYDRAFT_168547 [Aspergillus sydowii CBS 593.65]OJJ64672.1 hypothetical protein ASPSYDRAFT_168547 [Aspergillus sydowii CBS 593.65]